MRILFEITSHILKICADCRKGDHCGECNCCK